MNNVNMDRLKLAEAFLDDLATVSDDDVDYGDPALFGSFRDEAKVHRTALGHVLADVSAACSAPSEEGLIAKAANLIAVLREQHYGRMPDDLQAAHDAVRDHLAALASREST